MCSTRTSVRIATSNTMPATVVSPRLTRAMFLVCTACGNYDFNVKLAHSNPIFPFCDPCPC